MRLFLISIPNIAVVSSLSVINFGKADHDKWDQHFPVGGLLVTNSLDDIEYCMEENFLSTEQSHVPLCLEQLQPL